jgi:hypothetical protein
MTISMTTCKMHIHMGFLCISRVADTDPDSMGSLDPDMDSQSGPDTEGQK